MCFFKNSKIKTADKDLYVLKSTIHTCTDLEFVSSFRAYKYKKGVLYKKSLLNKILSIFFTTLSYEVFHTHDIRSSKYYLGSYPYVGAFMIPKGSKYYENPSYGEIACFEIMYMGTSQEMLDKVQNQ